MIFSTLDENRDYLFLSVEEHWGLNLGLKPKWVSQFHVVQGEDVLSFMSRVYVDITEDISFRAGSKDAVLRYWNG